jgi:hypothetical protein
MEEAAEGERQPEKASTPPAPRGQTTSSPWLCAGEPPEGMPLTCRDGSGEAETEEHQQPTAQVILDGALHCDVDDERRPPCHFWCRSGLT